MEKFKNVPIDEDTKSLFKIEIKFKDFDALHEKWVWDGVYAESLIFVDSDVAFMDDKALKKFIVGSDLVKKKNQITISRNKNGFTFVNFNFEIGI